MAIDPKELTVDYKELLKTTTNQERVSLTQSQKGREILSALTPTELSNIFPDYYKRNSEVSNYLSATSKKYSRGDSSPTSKSEIEKEETRRRGKTSAKPTEKRKDPIITKLEEKIPGFKTEPGAKARLSKEEENIVSELKKGNIKEDDPRISFLKNIDDKTLAGAGIKRNPDTKSYEYVPINITEDDIKKRAGLEASSKIIERGRVVSTASTNISPQQRALLDTIAHGESPDYNTIHGGRKFSDYKWHPGIKGALSTAAGRYQFIKSTWDDTVKEYNIKNPNNPITDFSPQNQDRAALYLAEKDYFRRTKRNLLNDINDPNNVKNIGQSLKIGLGGSGTNTTWQAFQLQNSEHWQKTYENNLKRNLGYANNALAKNATPEQIAVFREKLEQIEEEKRSSILAESQIPKKPPEGISEKVYGELSSAQKQSLWAAIQNDPNILKNIAESNNKPVTAINSEDLIKINFQSKNIEEGAKELKTTTQDALLKFSELEPNTEISSTYRSPDHPIEKRKKAPGAHTKGRAIDISTKNKTKEELSRTIQSLKKAGFNYILLEGSPPHIHAEVRPEQETFNINNLRDGHPTISLDDAKAAAETVTLGSYVRKNKNIENNVVSPIKTETPEKIAEPIPLEKKTFIPSKTEPEPVKAEPIKTEPEPVKADPSVSDIPEFASGGTPTLKSVEAIQNPVLDVTPGSPTEDNIHSKAMKVSTSENLKYEGTQPRIESADVVEGEKNKLRHDIDNKQYTNQIIQKPIEPSRMKNNITSIKENISNLNPTLEYINGPGSMETALKRNDYGNSLPNKRQFSSHLINYN